MRNSLIAGKLFCFLGFFFFAASLCLDFFWLFFEELLVVFPRIQKQKSNKSPKMGTGVDFFFGAGSTAAVAQVWFALY